MKGLFLLLLWTAVLLAAPSPAWAAIHDVNFCGKYAIHFEDADVAIGDDCYVSNVDRPARGALISVYDVTADEAVGSYYANYWPTSSPGCTEPIELDSTHQYRVTLKSRAYVNGNFVNVIDDPETRNLYGFIALPLYQPTSSGIETITTPIRTWWNIAAAAGYAFTREPAGLSGETFTFLPLPCPSGGAGSCMFTQTVGGVKRTEVYIQVIGGAGPSGERKYSLMHEMGHLVQFTHNDDTLIGSRSNAPFDTADPRDCYSNPARTHEINSEEYQSMAAAEGYASFYAAVVFNDGSESDCWFRYYRTVDWDIDDVLVEDPRSSCEGAPDPGLASADYFGEFCNLDDNKNRGVVYDWTRHLWDMRTDEGLTTEELFQIWYLADPDTWCDADIGDTSDPNCLLDTADPTDTGGQLLPPHRFSQAAYDLGGTSYQSKWDSQAATNGIVR